MLFQNSEHDSIANTTDLLQSLPIIVYKYLFGYHNKIGVK